MEQKNCTICQKLQNKKSLVLILLAAGGLIGVIAILGFVLIFCLNYRPVTPGTETEGFLTPPAVSAVPSETIESSPIPGNKIMIDYLPLPEKVARLSLINSLNGEPEPTDSEYYKLGTVRQGLVSLNGKTKDFKGFEYYVIAINKNRPIEVPLCNYVLLLKSSAEGVYYKMMDECMYVEDQAFPMVVKFAPAVNSEYAETIYPDNDPLIDYQFAVKNILTTAQGNSFYKTSLILPIIFNDSNSRKVDSVSGVNIYIDKNSPDVTFYSTRDHMRSPLQYIPKIVNIKNDGNEDTVIDITWNGGLKNSDSYQWISIGGCFNNMLEVSSVDMNTLKITGKAKDGSDIFEPKDINDAYMVKIYNEYKEWPDHESLTLQEFAARHPFFYWKDPYSRVIKFANDSYIFTGGCAKPAIYLYPEKTMQLTIKLEVNGKLTYSYPRYNPQAGWLVQANPDGKILNLSDYKIYAYLWWESRAGNVSLSNMGTVVTKADLESFLRKALSRLNLNEIEIRDFLEYWLPVMNKEESDYIFVSFLFNKQVDQLAKINYSIEPDNEIRVFMVYKPVDKYYNARPLIFPVNSRKGFTVVEWGGGRLQ